MACQCSNTINIPANELFTKHRLSVLRNTDALQILVGDFALDIVNDVSTNKWSFASHSVLKFVFEQAQFSCKYILIRS